MKAQIQSYNKMEIIQ